MSNWLDQRKLENWKELPYTVQLFFIFGTIWFIISIGHDLTHLVLDILSEVK